MNRFLPKLGVSLECQTENVPDDGQFYVLHNGEVVGAFQSYKPAEKRYKQLIEELGGSLTAPQRVLTPEEKLEVRKAEKNQRETDEYNAYWGSTAAHYGKKYRRRT